MFIKRRKNETPTLPRWCDHPLQSSNRNPRRFPPPYFILFLLSCKSSSNKNMVQLISKSFICFNLKTLLIHPHPSPMLLHLLSIFAASLMFYPMQGHCLSEAENCDNCQRVVFYSFQYYRYTTTKRLLRHRIKHLCNRYYEYRRHCLATLVPKVDQIWADMEKALDDEQAKEFKPIKTCQMLKECDKDHSPITIPRELLMAAANQHRKSTANPRTAEEDAGEAVTSDYIF